MRRSDFFYDLPPDLIAQHPLTERAASRLLVLEPHSEHPRDALFRDLPNWLAPGDLLVLNNTRVMRARLFGHKATGGRVEILIERLLGPRVALVHLRASKGLRAGARIHLEQGVTLVVEERVGDLFRIHAETLDLSELMKQQGHVPLPPYIQRPDEAMDADRYQTLWASREGAVAAPTAGLHFDAELLGRLQARGIEHAQVTLHVGAGTFQPVRAQEVEDHQMHAEWLEVDADLCARVEKTKAAGRRVIAVGTTSVRSLETAAADGELRPFRGDSRLFIYPGYRFRVVDGMVTNFHLPESTLLMLVAAFAGRERILHAYQHAIAARYRFFSYGDAMLLLAAPHP